MLDKNKLHHKSDNVKCFFTKQCEKARFILPSDNKNIKSVPKKPKNIKIVRKCATTLEETWI